MHFPNMLPILASRAVRNTHLGGAVRSAACVRAYSAQKPRDDDEKAAFGAPEPPAYTSSVSEAASEANAKPLPFLSQALGVSKRPTSESPTWTERHAEWFDRDVRLEKRRLMYVRVH